MCTVPALYVVPLGRRNGDARDHGELQWYTRKDQSYRYAINVSRYILSDPQATPRATPAPPQSRCVASEANEDYSSR